ncbi:cytochrome c [Alkalimonas collagenimarina]|uniref:Cytochrome c n=1 Tax=Alkalimonas collagenimarina TaxID=400390 RepID=A0ABT9H1C1_9GAMM|nr:cytochrome c [Alkalimonas collagenimarina]MDP4537008.1 cytochrome c [Alkalimonas collagenimarina]
MNRLSHLLIVVSIGLFAAACSDPESSTETAKQDPFAHLTAEEQETFRQGQARAHSCAACHGPMGISRNRMYPSIAGLTEAELKQALLDYRSGERTNPLMSPQARGLSDEDIELLAAYYPLLSTAR